MSVEPMDNQHSTSSPARSLTVWRKAAQISVRPVVTGKMKGVGQKISGRRGNTYFWLLERADKIGHWMLSFDRFHNRNGIPDEHMKFLFKSAGAVMVGTSIVSLYGAFFEGLLVASVAGIHYGSRFLPSLRNWYSNRRFEKQKQAAKKLEPK